jgi:hypothetical protein
MADGYSGLRRKFGDEGCFGISLAPDAPPPNALLRNAPMASRAWLAACILPTVLVNPWAMPIHTSSVALTPADGTVNITARIV